MYLNTTDWTGGNWATVGPDNTDGGKGDSLGTGGEIAPKFYNDYIWPSTDAGVTAWANLEGYWQHDGHDVVLWQDLISDRLTGRPVVQTKMARLGSATLDNFTDNGALTYASNAISQSDQTLAVARNGSVTFNPATGATGGGGAISVKTDLVIKPNHGRLKMDGNSVTYEPFRGYTGEDQFYLFLESDGQFKTVLYVVQIGGSGGGLAIPQASTNFTASAAGGLSVEVALLSPPDSDSRNIVRTEYSTDGEPWRKLCNFWIQDTHTLTVRSNGAAFTSGTVDIRVRYKCTNHDVVSAPSVASTVNVT